MSKGLNKLVGLTDIKDNFRLQLARCRKKHLVYPHTLVHGIGGLGKTELAVAMCEELGYYLHQLEAAELKKRGIVFSVLTEALEIAKSKSKTLFLFVDEIHRLNDSNQESFYYPMKEFKIIKVERGSRTEYKINPFTLFGATTRKDLLDQNSLVARFDNVWQLDRYHHSHIQDMLNMFFRKEGLGCGPTELFEIAVRSLGIPRKAINLAERVSEVSHYHNHSRITPEDISETFMRQGIDHIGLDKVTRQYLYELLQGPKGLDYLAGRLNQPTGVIEDSIEPILLNLGFIDRSRIGRQLTINGKNHILNIN